MVHPFGQTPRGYEAWTEAHGVDIAPPATHWSAKEAEAHAAAKASAMAAAKAAAAPPLEPQLPLDCCCASIWPELWDSTIYPGLFPH